MKITFLAILFFVSFSNASLVQKGRNYLHVPTGRVVSVKEEISATGMASLWRPFNEIVSISDLSREVEGSEINEVGSEEMILIQTPGSLSLRSCEALHVFENGMVNFDCLDGWHQHDFGRDPIYSRWNVHTSQVIPEVSSLNSFDKKSCAILKSSVSDLEAKDKVRVDVIFKNGEVLVRKMGLNLLHTDPAIINPFIRRSHLSNLIKCPETTVDQLLD